MQTGDDRGGGDEDGQGLRSIGEVLADVLPKLLGIGAEPAGCVTGSASTREGEGLARVDGVDEGGGH